jgi:membrane-associated protein
MNYKQFVIFDAIGDTAWATSVTLIGYWFGSRIPNLDRYIMTVFAVVVIVTLSPTFYHLARAVYEKRTRL